MTKDVHQSDKYGQYMRKIGWIVEKVDGCQIFIRQFSPIGSFIKIQRPNFSIPFKKIEKIAKDYRGFKIVIELSLNKQSNGRATHLSGRQIEQFRKFGYKKTNSPYLPTKTIHIDLSQPEKEILAQMKKKTRYCLRRAQKSGLTVKKSKDIESFIHLKLRHFFPFSFLIKKEIKTLWQIFYPKNAVILEAKRHNDAYHCDRILGGVLLLFHQGISHYWLAASTKRGKKLFAPTLLVWEAVKLSKKRGCKIFDFEGIYDQRFQKATKSWQGFTRFKRGFGGQEIEYPGCFIKFRFPF